MRRVLCSVELVGGAGDVGVGEPQRPPNKAPHQLSEGQPPPLRQVWQHPLLRNSTPFLRHRPLAVDASLRVSRHRCIPIGPGR